MIKMVHKPTLFLACFLLTLSAMGWATASVTTATGQTLSILASATTASAGDSVTFSVNTNTNGLSLKAYDFSITYNPSFAKLTTSTASAAAGTSALGAPGVLNDKSSSSTSSSISVNDFDVTGATGSDLNLLKFTFLVTGNAVSGTFSVNVKDYGDGGATSPSFTSMPTATVNLAVPTITSAAIVQTTLQKGDTASLNVVSSTSPAPTSLNYQWLIDGADITGATSATLALKDYASVVKGKSLTCKITPVSGSTTYTAVTTTAVFVANTAPVGGTVSISPVAATPGQAITATATGGTDVDGDTITYSYAWSKNGTAQNITTAMVEGSLITKDASWTVSATPNDGTTNGTAITLTVTIGSAAPVVSNVSLSSNVGFATTEITIVIHASDLDGDLSSYSFDTNGDGTMDVTQASNVLKSKFTKGTYKISGRATDATSKSSATVSAGELVISNSTPVVNAGFDRSGGINIMITQKAFGSDADVSDQLTYTWTLVSGTAVTIANGSTNVMSFTPAAKGSYIFNVSLSDGTVSASDNIVFSIDDLFKVITVRTLPADTNINAISTVNIASEADVTNVLENTFALSSANLSANVRTDAFSAIGKVFGSPSSIAIDNTQVAQSLGTLDNLVGSSSDNLSSADVKNITTSISNMHSRVSTVSETNVNKTYEVLDKVLKQQTVSGNQKLVNLDGATQQSVGSAIMKTVAESSKALASGQTKEIDMANLKIRAQALAIVTSETVVGDNTQGYTIKLPASFALTPVVVSATKMAVNPHKGKVSGNVKEPVGEIVSFNVNKLGTSDKYSFTNSVKLTIPSPDGSSLSSGNTFQPKFFDETNLTWSTNGISNVVYSKSDNLVSFDVTHLTDFSVVDEPAPTVASAGGGGGGGCLLK